MKIPTKSVRKTQFLAIQPVRHIHQTEPNKAKMHIHAIQNGKNYQQKNQKGSYEAKDESGDK